MSRENFRQCLAAINVLCSIFMTGINKNWVSAVIPKLRSGEDGLKADNDQISWIVSLSENVLCSIFMTGVNTNWVSAVIPKLRSGEDGLKANADQIAWIVSLSETGRFMGPIVTAVILDRIGRRS